MLSRTKCGANGDVYQPKFNDTIAITVENITYKDINDDKVLHILMHWEKIKLFPASLLQQMIYICYYQRNLKEISSNTCNKENQRRKRQKVGNKRKSMKKRSSSKDDERKRHDKEDVEIKKLCLFKSCLKELAESIWYLVPDTNILIHHLDKFCALKDTPIGAYRLPHLYIPWMVVLELDNLKTKKSTHARAQAANKSLHDLILMGGSRVHIDVPTEEHHFFNFNVLDGDNIILQNCCRLKDQGINFIVISNDINFRFKILSHDLLALSIDDIQKDENF